MSVTSAQVAARAGVSRSTVSYILNGQGHRFTDETRAAVQRAVDELGYAPLAAGRSLAMGKSDLVLATLPLAPNGMISGVLARLTEELSQHGFSLLVRVSTASILPFQTAVRTLRPRALIALADLTAEERRVLKLADVPAIELARWSSQPGQSQWMAGRLQGQHLIESGYKRIAYARLVDARDDVMQRARQLGVMAACGDAGIAAPVAIDVAQRADADLEAVRSLRSGAGVACYNDETAAAVLAAAHVAKLDVPGDLGIIGMDNGPIAAQTSPRLTTIAVEADVNGWVVQLLTSEGAWQSLPAEPPVQIHVVEGDTV